MRLGFIADAHGNPLGLMTCLAQLQAYGVSQIYFLGDAVGYFPDAAAVLNALQDSRAQCVMGNHEAMLLERLPLDTERDEVYRLGAGARLISSDHLRTIESWPDSAYYCVDGVRILCMHGRPEETLTGYFHADDNPDALHHVDADLLVMAHTHRPFCAELNNLTVLNPGSVGLPRQGGGWASSAVFDTDTGQADILKAPLPIERLCRTYVDMVHPSVIDVLRR